MNTSSPLSLPYAWLAAWCGTVCLISATSNAVALENVQLTEELTARATNAIQALSDINWLVRRRAMQELGELEFRDNRILTALLEMLRTKAIDGESATLVESLAGWVDGGDTAALEKSLPLLDGNRAVLASCAIGRGGTSSIKLISQLQDKASDEKSTPKVRLAARVALANLGVERQTNLAAIRTNLLPNASLSDDLLLALLLTKPGVWAADPLTGHVSVLLSEGTDTDRSALAAVLAASWETSGRELVPLISSKIQAAKTNSDQGTALLVYQCCKARLERKSGSWITGDLLKVLGSDQHDEHTWLSGCLLISNFLLKEPDVAEVIRLVGDKDPNVALGASKLCVAIGVPAHRAEDSLLNQARTSADERVRTMAVMALGTLASEACIPKLRALKARDSNSVDGTVIETAIGVIALHSEQR